MRDLLLVTVIALVAISQQTTMGQDGPAKNPNIKVELPAEVFEPDAGLVEHLATHSQDKICQALLKQLGINPDKSKDRITALGCKLVSSYKTASGEPRYVFVYDPNWRAWPGVQPQTIVIVDGRLSPLSWKEVGGSPMMVKVAFAVDADNPVVSITCAHRHTFTHPRGGTYRYSLRGDEIHALGEPVWIYPPSSTGVGLVDGLCHRSLR